MDIHVNIKNGKERLTAAIAAPVLLVPVYRFPLSGSASTVRGFDYGSVLPNHRHGGGLPARIYVRRCPRIPYSKEDYRRPSSRITAPRILHVRSWIPSFLVACLIDRRPWSTTSHHGLDHCSVPMLPCGIPPWPR